MKLEFEISQEDLYEFYKFEYWYSPDRKKYRISRRFIVGLLLLSTPLLFHYLGGEDRQFNSKIIYNLLFWGVLIAYFGISYTKYYSLRLAVSAVDTMLAAGKNQDLLGKQLLEIKDDLIEYKTENTESKFNFKMIEKVREDQSYYYIYITVYSAFIIPKMSFQSEKDEAEFKVILGKWV